MKLYTNFIPPELIVRYADHTIPPKMIMETVDVYEEALPYIECQMRNTIRHEAEHRKDEEQGRPEDMSSQQWMEESRVEPIAEKAESEDCESLKPQEISGNVTSVNTDDVFQRAKSASGISSTYLQDVKAVMLPDNVLGMYYMQDMPSGLDSVGYGWDGSQYINVGNFFKPWMAKKEKQVLPPTIQFDGTEPDPELSNIPGSSPSVNAIPSIPSVPSTPSRSSR